MTNARNTIRMVGLAGAIAMAMGGALVGAQAAEMERTRALETLLKAAQAEGTLNVIWGPSLGAAKGARALQDAINKAYGLDITVNYTPGPSMPRMAGRTIQEAKAGRTASSDVFLGVEVNLPNMLKAKVLRSVPWSDYFPSIKSNMHINNGYAVHIVTLFNGIHYNTQLIKPHEVPKKFADIFKPKWKGKIASTPYAVAFDRLSIIHGMDVIRPVVQKIAQWSGGLIRCGEYERLASGEFIMLVLDCGRTDDTLLTSNGGPLDQVLLEDALGTTLWYFAVPTNSAHPNLAALFAGFVATPAGQKIIQAHGGASSHLVAGTRANKRAKALEARGKTIPLLTPDDIMPRAKELLANKKEFQRTLRKK
jgi:iron(III) transport system substrate-binding protein